MTAPTPPTVETLAVLIAALDRRLTAEFDSTRREEKERREELRAWRDEHNNLLKHNRETYDQKLDRSEYQREHERLREDINNLSGRLVETEGRLREDITRNGNRITAIEGHSSGVSKSLAMVLLVLTGLSMIAGFVGALHAITGHAV